MHGASILTFFIQGLSSLGIILREIYKAELELSNGFANVTSALVMQMPGYSLPRYSAHHLTNTSNNDGGHSEGIMVAVETSRLEDSDAKPVSIMLSKAHIICLPTRHLIPRSILPGKIQANIPFLSFNCHILVYAQHNRVYRDLRPLQNLLHHFAVYSL